LFFKPVKIIEEQQPLTSQGCDSLLDVRFSENVSPN
jgi:hypothetical protein